MERQDRHGRTVRLLEAHLEVLALASERRPGAAPVAGRVVGVRAATRNAVALELLSPEEADAIWAAVARRHPAVAWCRAGPGLAI